MDNCDHDEATRLTKQAYDKHGVEYTIYHGNNRFDGTPVPEGYKAVYKKDEMFPDYLSLEKI
jgi:hypothetical protein